MAPLTTKKRDRRPRIANRLDATAMAASWVTARTAGSESSAKTRSAASSAASAARVAGTLPAKNRIAGFPVGSNALRPLLVAIRMPAARTSDPKTGMIHVNRPIAPTPALRRAGGGGAADPRGTARTPAQRRRHCPRSGSARSGSPRPTAARAPLLGVARWRTHIRDPTARRSERRGRPWPGGPLMEPRFVLAESSRRFWSALTLGEAPDLAMTAHGRPAHSRTARSPFRLAPAVCRLAPGEVLRGRDGQVDRVLVRLPAHPPRGCSRAPTDDQDRFLAVEAAAGKACRRASAAGARRADRDAGDAALNNRGPPGDPDLGGRSEFREAGRAGSARRRRALGNRLRRRRGDRQLRGGRQGAQAPDRGLPSADQEAAGGETSLNTAACGIGIPLLSG